MPIHFIADDGDTEDIGDIDPHFYEKQLPASDPFGDNAFLLATARAKDKARVKLIKAVRQADLAARSEGLGLGLDGFARGTLVDPKTGTATAGGVVVWRTIDGVPGGADDDIVL